jgi:hypothetical protein
MLPIYQLSVSGDTVWRTTVPCQARPIPRRFVDSIVTLQGTFAAQALKISQREGEALVRAQLKPSTLRWFPAIAGAHLGRDGSVWIMRMTAGSDTIQLWTRVDRPSTNQATFALPPHFSLLLVSDSAHVWAVNRDENVAPVVVRFRVAGR